MVGVVDLTCEKGKQHKGDVSVLIPDDKGHLYSGGADGLIKIWDQDLKLVRDIVIHKDYVLDLAFNSKGELYSSSRDGTLKFLHLPLRNDQTEVLHETALDDLNALQCIQGEDIMFSGDDKGIVVKWYHRQVVGQYNVLKEVKSMAIENNLVYTAQDNDIVITDVTPGISHFATKGTIPGTGPLWLIGPVEYGHRKFLVFATRDGKGITLARNESPFETVWTKEAAHDYIITAIAADDDYLYTADFNGKLKKWSYLDKEAKLLDELDTGKRINTACIGPGNFLYVGDSDGAIKRIKFKK